MPFNDVRNKDIQNSKIETVLNYEESSLKYFLENRFLQELIPSEIYSVQDIPDNIENITNTLLTLNTELENTKNTINTLQAQIQYNLVQLSNANNQNHLQEKNTSLVKKI